MVEPPPYTDHNGLPHPPPRGYEPAYQAAPQPQPQAPPYPQSGGFHPEQLLHAPQLHMPNLDPVLAGFDRVVALGCYGLLFVSPFTFGVPALAALVLALFHRHDSHLIVRSHYLFQIRIFLTALLFFVVAVGGALVGGGLMLGQFVGFLNAHAHQVAAVIGPSDGARQTMIASGLVLIAFLFFGISVLWTLGASSFGFLRLLANRPIGHGIDHR